MPIKGVYILGIYSHEQEGERASVLVLRNWQGKCRKGSCCIFVQFVLLGWSLMRFGNMLKYCKTSQIYWAVVGPDWMCPFFCLAYRTLTRIVARVEFLETVLSFYDRSSSLNKWIHSIHSKQIFPIILCPYLLYFFPSTGSKSSQKRSSLIAF